MKKVGTKGKNLIHCFETLSDCRVIQNSELELQKSITLDFNVSFQDNSLVYDDDKEKELNQRQIILHSLIFYMYEERGMSYRKISKWLNRSGIKTHQGNTWGETGNSVYSVLKRMKERDYRLNSVRKFKTKSEITNFKIYE
jgi:hypothetical protein